MPKDMSSKVGGRRKEAAKSNVNVTRPRGKPITAPGGFLKYKDSRGQYTGKESCN